MEKEKKTEAKVKAVEAEEEVKKEIKLGPIPENSIGQWLDISDENWREYSYPEMKVRIASPVRLYIKTKFGAFGIPVETHRVIDAAGQPHYIPSGWRHLTWETTSDQPFDF